MNKFTLCTTQVQSLWPAETTPNGPLSACIWSPHHRLAGGHQDQRGIGREAGLWLQGPAVPCQRRTAWESGTAWFHTRQRTSQDTLSLQSQRACRSSVAAVRCDRKCSSLDPCCPRNGQTCTPAGFEKKRKMKDNEKHQRQHPFPPKVETEQNSGNGFSSD